MLRLYTFMVARGSPILKRRAWPVETSQLDIQSPNLEE
jgi:hypothetical protein